MEKSIFEQMGGTYTLVGDYYLPNLTVPEKVAQPIGIWAQHRLRYIKDHRKALYTSLLLEGKLNAHLAEIEQQAQELFFRLVEQMATREGVTEQLKAEDQMAWVGRMNNIRNRAEEIVCAELVYMEDEGACR